MSDRIEKKIDLKAPIERVWRALTVPEEFGAWFRVRLDGAFAVGEVTTGQITCAGYEHYRWCSKTETIDHERYVLAFTWTHPEDPAHTTPDDPSTRVELRLTPVAGGTRLELVESGFENLPPDRRADIFRGNEEGWAIQMNNIRAHVDA